VADAFRSEEIAESLSAARSEVVAVKGREKKLLDAYLDGHVPSDVYRERAGGLANTRRALELRVSEATRTELDPIEQVRDVALTASSARIRFQEADESKCREIVQTVLWNLGVEDGT
jgi:hypothetical protein